MKPKILVPPSSETINLYPIVQLLLADCQEHFVNVDAIDVREVWEQFQRVRETGEDLEFRDLFGEPYFLTRDGVPHVISVHRGFARHVPARSEYFDVERISAGALPAAD